MGIIKISDFGRPGFVKDIAEYDSVPEAWNEVRNVRFNPIGAQSFAGHQSVLSPGSITPLWLRVFPPIDLPIWIYANNTRVFAYDGNHTELTRLSGEYNGNAQQRWQGEVFQNLGIFNNVLDVPQLWPSFNVSQKFIDLPNWPSDVRCRALRPFKSFLIAMYMIEAGNERPYRVRWSHIADPGTYPSSWALDDPTKDSGQIDIASTSDYIVDGLELGDYFIVYKQRSTYAMQYVAGQYIFSQAQILSSRGLLWRDCVQSFPGGHFVVGIDDIYVHTGTRESDKSLVEARLRNWIFNQIDSSNFFNCYTVKYSRRNEFWFCFPEVGETYPTLAVVWNSVTGGIGIRDIPRSPFIYPGPINTGPTPRIWGEEAEPEPTGGVVTYVEDSRETFTVSTANIGNLIALTNSMVTPEDFPNAVLILTVAIWGTVIVPYFTRVGGLNVSVLYTEISAEAGEPYKHLAIGMIRIPPGGFDESTLELDWETISGEPVTNFQVSTQVFYNVHTSSDGFLLGTVQAKNNRLSNGTGATADATGELIWANGGNTGTSGTKKGFSGSGAPSAQFGDLYGTTTPDQVYINNEAIAEIYTDSATQEFVLTIVTTDVDKLFGVLLRYDVTAGIFSQQVLQKFFSYNATSIQTVGSFTTWRWPATYMLEEVPPGADSADPFYSIYGITIQEVTVPVGGAVVATAIGGTSDGGPNIQVMDSIAVPPYTDLGGPLTQFNRIRIGDVSTRWNRTGYTLATDQEIAANIFIEEGPGDAVLGIVLAGTAE